MADTIYTDIDQYRFLIVDDEQFSRSLMEQLLRSLGGAKIALACDGGEALKILLETPTPIDCVLTDLNMAPVNGLELLKVIRIGYGDIDRATAVIVFTGLVDMKLVPPAIDLDVNGFLAKPVAKDLLKAAIQRAYEVEDLIQNPDVYRRVPIPETSDLKAIALKLGLISPLPILTPGAPSSPGKQGKTAPKDDAGEMREVIPTPQFAGHILTKDIVSHDGTLILAAGANLTERIIHRIIDLQKIDHTLGHTIFVNSQMP